MITNPDDLRSLVADTLLKTLGDDKRDELITKAIKGLLAPTKEAYGMNGPSELEHQFQYAAQNVARQLINDRLVNDADFKSKMVTVINEAVQKFLTDKKEATVDRMAQALADGFKMQY